MSFARERERRANAGNNLLEQEQDFEQEEIFMEEENDVDFEAQDEKDIVDSDFDDTSEDEEAEDEGERLLIHQEKEDHKKERAIAIAKQTLPRSKPKRQNVASVDGPPPPKKVKVTPTVPSFLRSETHGMRKSTRTHTIEVNERVQDKLKEYQRRRSEYQQRAKPKETSRPMTQEELLAEAAITERKNIQSLNQWTAMEAERRKAARAVMRKELFGPVITYRSFREGVEREDGKQYVLKRKKSMILIREYRPRPPKVDITSKEGEDMAATITTDLEGTQTADKNKVNGETKIDNMAKINAIEPVLEGQDANPKKIQREDSERPVGHGPPHKLSVIESNEEGCIVVEPRAERKEKENEDGCIVVQSPVEANEENNDDSCILVQPRTELKEEKNEDDCIVIKSPREQKGEENNDASHVIMRSSGGLENNTVQKSSSSNHATKNLQNDGTDEVGDVIVVQLSPPLDHKANPNQGTKKGMVVDDAERVHEEIIVGGDSSEDDDNPPEFVNDPRQSRNFIILKDFHQLHSPYPMIDIYYEAVFGKNTRHQRATTVREKIARNRRPEKPLCPITGQVARYRDPKTNIPYATRESFAVIRQVLNNEFIWSNALNAYVHRSDVRAAKGVPDDFEKVLNPPNADDVIQKEEEERAKSKKVEQDQKQENQECHEALDSDPETIRVELEKPGKPGKPVSTVKESSPSKTRRSKRRLSSIVIS